MKLGRLRSNKGFTLVELMTVVAIIGALAALGVPQYRKMQRKAKRAEANMVLGVIASAEAAFFAEYNGYGNNMGGIGAEMDNDPQYYDVGFLAAAGATGAARVQATVAPTVFSVRAGGAGGVSNFPQNFNGYADARIRGPRTAPAERIAHGIEGSFVPPGGVLRDIIAPAAPRGGNCGTASPARGDIPANLIGLGWSTTDANRPVFRAMAQGNLYQQDSAPSWDCVSINHQREINTERDGS